MNQPSAIGTWRIRSLLHRGHNSTVYAAAPADADEAAGATVALKVCSMTKGVRFDRFVQEIGFLRQSTDLGVLPLIDSWMPTVGGAKARPWLATPLAITLRAALRDSPLPVVVSAVAEVATTLSRLAQSHQHHRDIKPDNLYLLDGRALIGDFGLVTFPGKPDLTVEGRPLGAIDYMAPEMRTDPTTSAPEPADVYGLAKSLWHLATRRIPVPGPIDHPQLGLRALLPDTRAYLLDVVIAASTQFEPARRPSMEDFARQLQSWLEPHEPKGLAPDLDIKDAFGRIAVFAEKEDARYTRRNELVLAANRAFNALTPTFHTIVARLPEMHGSGGFTTGTAMFDWFPQLSSGNPIQRAGGATLRRTSEIPVNLVAFFGSEARRDGLVRLVGAYALRRVASIELIWHEIRDFLPDSPLAEQAVADIGDALGDFLPAAMQAWARALEEEPTA